MAEISIANRGAICRELLPAAIVGALSLLPAGLYMLAIPCLVAEKFLRGQSAAEIGFGLRGLRADVRRHWLWVLLPAGTACCALLLSRLLVPGFFEHVLARTRPMLALDRLPVLAVQLPMLALAEEICFRAFLQRKLTACSNAGFAIAITSFAFAMGHFAAGAPAVVLYDLVCIYIDSVLYGSLFRRTNSVFLCWIAHFLANLCGILILLAMDRAAG